METRHIIYCLTLPNGKCYIGQTRQTLETRLRQHIQHGRKRKASHPFYDAMRKYGPESVVAEVIAEVRGQTNADVAEVAAIAEAQGRGVSLNVSPGGDGDMSAAHAAVKEMLLDPKRRARYIESLRAGVLSSPAHRSWVRGGLAEAAAEWRKSNPRDVYRQAYRASRIAGRGQPKLDPRFDEATGRLAIKSRKVMAARMSYIRRGIRTWHDSDNRQEIHSRIAEGVRAHHAAKTPEAREAHAAQLAKARKNIDHDKRKSRQREALAVYWTPERRAAKSAEMKAIRAKERELKAKARG